MTERSIGDIEAQIDAWLAAKNPALLERLAPPASDAELTALETALGTSLPDDYRASLRVHAGGRVRRGATSLYSESPFYELRLLAPQVLLERREWLAEYATFPTDPYARITPTVRHAYQDADWSPIAAADEDLAVFYCIDTVPVDPAARLQIVEMVTNDSDRRAPWPSFRALLAELVLRPIEENTPIDENLIEETGMIGFVQRD